MDQNFHGNLLDENGINAGDKLLLACSGGLDSMVMVHLFAGAAEREGVELVVGHVNHQLRHAADEDEQFVRDQCASLGLPCLAERVDVSGAMAGTGDSEEMAARRLRYAALERMRCETGATYICTAHTKSDQAETVLMRMLSGAGVAGLQGIRRRRGHLLRPLLHLTRKDIRDFADHHQVASREDASNQDTSIRRNYIRHRLIPQIVAEVNPSLEEALSRIAAVQTEVETMLSSIAEDAMDTVLIEQTEHEIILDILGLQNYFTPVQKTIIFNCLSELGLRQPSLNFPQMQQILTILTSTSSGISMALPGGITLWKDRTRALLTTQSGSADFREDFREAGTTRLGDYLITARELAAVPEQDIRPSRELEAYFDGETLRQLHPEWRSWQHGDIMQLPHGGTKKISDVWIDHKIPVWEKHSRPLLASGRDVLWIPGMKRSGIGWLTKATRSVIHLTARKAT